MIIFPINLNRKDGETEMASVSSTITLVDQMSGALAGIEASINSMKSTLQSVAGEQTSIDNFNWDKFTQNAQKAGEKISKIGQQMSLALTAPLIMLGKEMFGDAVEYEAAYTGMTKTVPGTIEQYQKLNETVLELSENTPSSYTESRITTGIIAIFARFVGRLINGIVENPSKRFSLGGKDQRTKPFMNGSFLLVLILIGIWICFQNQKKAEIIPTLFISLTGAGSILLHFHVI